MVLDPEATGVSKCAWSSLFRGLTVPGSALSHFDVRDNQPWNLINMLTMRPRSCVSNRLLGDGDAAL